MKKSSVITLQSKLQESLDDFYFDPQTPIDDKFEVLANLFLEQAVHAMADMSAKDAMIGAGIAIDKMQLLRGLPTEIKTSIPLLLKIAERLAEENISLSTALTKYLSAINDA